MDRHVDLFVLIREELLTDGVFLFVCLFNCNCSCCICSFLNLVICFFHGLYSFDAMTQILFKRRQMTNMFLKVKKIFICVITL